MTPNFRLKLWKKKTDPVKKSLHPKLCLLPPMAAALDLNTKRAYYQAMIWKSCLQNGPPPLDQCNVHVLVYTFKIFQTQPPTFYLYMALL